jgi:hypothetical protein
MRWQQALSDFAQNSSRRTIINVTALLIFLLMFYAWHPGLTWHDLRYGLIVGGFLAALDFILRALIKRRYGTAPPAKHLSQVVTIAYWISYISIVSVYW